MWFSQKLGFRAFWGISCKNWDFRQNIWISGARGHLKSPQKSALKSIKMREIPIFAKFQYLENLMGGALNDISRL